MTNVINLRQRRKAKARTDKEKKSAENRAVHGRTKAEKLREKTETERATRHIDGHKRQHDSENTDDEY